MRRRSHLVSVSSIQKAQHRLGTAVVNQRFGQSQQDFITHVGKANWLQVAEHQGLPAAQGLIANQCDGRTDPHEGLVVVCRPPKLRENVPN